MAASPEIQEQLKLEMELYLGVENLDVMTQYSQARDIAIKEFDDLVAHQTAHPDEVWDSISIEQVLDQILVVVGVSNIFYRVTKELGTVNDYLDLEPNSQVVDPQKSDSETACYTMDVMRRAVMKLSPDPHNHPEFDYKVDLEERSEEYTLTTVSRWKPDQKFVNHLISYASMMSTTPGSEDAGHYPTVVRNWLVWNDLSAH